LLEAVSEAGLSPVALALMHKASRTGKRKFSGGTAKLLREVLGLKLGELTTVVKGLQGGVKAAEGSQILASSVSRSRLSQPDKDLVFPASGDFNGNERIRRFYKRQAVGLVKVCFLSTLYLR
jgi:hypothetical protein